MEQLAFSDLYAQETLRHPIAFYGQKRDQAPLARVAMSGLSGWIITTGYAESVELLRDPRLVCAWPVRQRR